MTRICRLGVPLSPPQKGLVPPGEKTPKADDLKTPAARSLGKLKPPTRLTLIRPYLKCPFIISRFTLRALREPQAGSGHGGEAGGICVLPLPPAPRTQTTGSKGGAGILAVLRKEPPPAAHGEGPVPAQGPTLDGAFTFLLKRDRVGLRRLFLVLLLPRGPEGFQGELGQPQGQVCRDGGTRGSSCVSAPLRRTGRLAKGCRCPSLRPI